MYIVLNVYKSEHSIYIISYNPHNSYMKNVLTHLHMRHLIAQSYLAYK